MFTAVGAFVLLAALLHASWNAMLHGSRDRYLSMTWMCIGMGALAIVVLPFVPLPAAGAWPYVVASGVVHVVYNLCLVKAYDTGDLGVAYPIARGSSPLLVTLGAALFAAERLTPLHVAGIAMVSAGIIVLALQQGRVTRAGLIAASLTGATIALYTVIDGIGVRLAGGTTATAISYTGWMFLFFLFTPVIFVMRRGVSALRAPVKDAAGYLTGGLVSVAAYGIVIWAMEFGPMGAVSALRETSVLFAVLLGRIFLKEKLSLGKLSACTVIALGALAIGA